MTWLWVKHRHTTDQTMEYSASWWSKLTSPRTLLGSESRRCLKLVLNTASYGFTTLPVTRLGSVNDVSLYCIDFTSVEIVHMTDPDDWFHIPIRPVSPALAETRYTDFASKGVIFNQSGAGSAFLKHAFAQRHILTNKELELVCQHLMLDPLPTTRESCIRSLCAKLCDGSSEEATRKYTDDALANLLVTKKKKDGVNSKLLTSPLNVQCFGELPGDDQDDLKDVAEAQKSRRRADAARRYRHQIERTRANTHAAAKAKAGAKAKAAPKAKAVARPKLSAFARNVRRRMHAPDPGPAASDGNAREPILLPAASAWIARGPSRRSERLPWSPVNCNHCGKLQGRYKLDDDPALGATEVLGRWEVQIWDYRQERWGDHYPMLSKRLASKVGEDATWAKGWLQSYRACC